MAGKYQMQATASDQQLKSWLSDQADRQGLLFPGPGSPKDVAVYSSPIASVTNNAAVRATVQGPTAAFSATFRSHTNAVMAASCTSPVASFIVSSNGPVDPTILAGSASLAITARADRGITLGATLLNVNSAVGGVTLTGNLAQSCAIVVLISDNGVIGTGKFDLSIDGGNTFILVRQTITSTFQIPGMVDPITLNFAAALYIMGSPFRATVAQWVDYKSGFVFAQATASAQPTLEKPLFFGGQYALHFVSGKTLICTTAGVAAWAAGNDAPYSAVFSTRFKGTGVNGGGVLIAGSTTTSALLAFGIGTAGNWISSKVGDSGGFVFSGNVTPSSSNTTYNTLWWSSGTTASAQANGATVINNAAQDTVTATTIDKLTLGAGAADCWLSEFAIYNGDQHTVLAPVVAYMTARYTDLASDALPDSVFFGSGASVAGQFPITQIPNDWRNREHRADVRFSVAPGVTSLPITAIPTFNGGVGRFNSLAVYLDGVSTPYTRLVYDGGVGARATQTLTLDGAAHTVQIDEWASLCPIPGVTLTTYSAPNTAVVLAGDSITFGFEPMATIDGAAGWSAIVKHGLNQAIYGTKIHGIQGDGYKVEGVLGAAVTAFSTLIAGLLDGTAKNILVLAFGTNDFAAEPATTIATQCGNICDAVIALKPAVKIVIFSPLNRLTETGGFDSLPTVRTALQGVATARPANCSYMDGNGIINPATDMSGDPHPNHAGYAKIAAAVLPVIQAL